MVLSAGGVGSRGRCSVEEERELFVLEMLVWLNLKRPFNFWPNWEAEEVLRARLPVGLERVGLFAPDDVVIVVIVCTMGYACSA